MSILFSHNRNDKNISHEVLIPMDKYENMSLTEKEFTISLAKKESAGKDIFLDNPGESLFLDEMQNLDAINMN